MIKKILVKPIKNIGRTAYFTKKKKKKLANIAHKISNSKLPYTDIREIELIVENMPTKLLKKLALHGIQGNVRAINQLSDYTKEYTNTHMDATNSILLKCIKDNTTPLIKALKAKDISMLQEEMAFFIERYMILSMNRNRLVEHYRHFDGSQYVSPMLNLVDDFIKEYEVVKR